MPLTPEKKLNVLYRVEPGCLGPDGIQQIEDFCRFAEIEVKTVDSELIHWEIVPRYDKKLDEMTYRVMGKKLSYQQAEKYLTIFDKSLDNFEEHLHEKLAELIEKFLGRH